MLECDLQFGLIATCIRLLQNYFDFYRANLNCEKNNTERFLGSNLQCCLHTTVLLAVKFIEKFYM